ncbi:MAG: globin domain-containing protein [Longimicrobiales bacterium]
MDPRPDALLAESWSRLAPHQEALAAAFYDRLFHLEPRVRDLFAAADMDVQPEKFVAMLGHLVRLGGEPDRLAAELQASGGRHASYGVTARHYRLGGEALLWALDRVAPGGLDAPTRHAWAEAYTRMASLMQRRPA